MNPFRRLQTFVVVAMLSLFWVSAAAAQDDVGDWMIEEISSSQGEPGEPIELITNANQLVCSMIDSRGIDQITEFLGITSGNGELEFDVPEWDAGTYSIVCYATDPPGGGSVIGSTNTVSFTIVRQSQTQLPQPEDYFGRTWSPPWLEPLSDHISPVPSTNQRVIRTVTITRDNVNFQLRIEAVNSTLFNDYINSANVFFEVLSSPANFNITTDSQGTREACPLPAAMAIDHVGRVLPDPPLENRLRARAALSGEIIGAIQPGEEFFVLDGPVCSGGINWWYVESDEGTGWTAEGAGNTYYAETYPEIDVEISATGNYPSSQTNVLYFYVDPPIDRYETHRYRSRDEFSASARARVDTGEVALMMFRTSPAGYYRRVDAGANEYTAWLRHTSEPTAARYAAHVRGVGNRSQYSLQGTFELGD